MSTPNSNSVTAIVAAVPAGTTGTLIGGGKWGPGGVGTGTALDYSFVDAGSTFSATYPAQVADFLPPTALSGAVQANAILALESIAKVAGITFTAVADTAGQVGDIRFGVSEGVPDLGAGTVAFAYFPSSGPHGGDVWLSPDFYGANNADAGSLQFMALIHEVGHGLGLKHPFGDAPTLPTAQNTFFNTIMSYSAKPGSVTIHPDRYPTTPMQYDIDALQYLYGANTTTTGGDDVYEYDSGGKYWETIWDGGGNDGIVVTGAGNAEISLNAGYLKIGTPISFTDGTTDARTVAIAKNVTIESATTGAGNDKLTGNAAANTLDAGAGNDTLDGGTGADTLIGGAGNDIYIVDAADVVTEGAGGGTDSVQTKVASFDMSTSAENVEILRYSGTANFTGTGNALDNIIIGGDGTDTLAGNGGLDRLLGGKGSDTYIVDTDDIVTEVVNGGTDTIETTGNFKLGANLENLTFVGTGDFTGTGNSVVNVITAGTGDDTLDGGVGKDTLVGGAGDDTYYVDTAGELVDESTGSGTDTIITTLTTFDLATNTAIENITFTGSKGAKGFGNASDNILTGSAGGDTLDGKGGTDTLIGGKGNDVYIVTAADAGDTLVEVAGGGTDQVNTTLTTYTLGAEIENVSYTGTAAPLTFTGNASNNVLTGGTLADTLTGLDGNDTLDGGAGVDTLIGGAGNDTYVMTAGDAIVELAAEGTDTIKTTVTSVDLSAGSLTEIENVTYTGTTSFTGTGNGSVNVLTGAAGNDSLDGLAGADTLDGGAGNDTYAVDDAGDVIKDKSGIDHVVTTLNAYTLETGLEHLTFSGSGDFVGTGNSLANTIIGGTGDDTLDGGGGIDKMSGGLGDDIYFKDNKGDVITDTGGTDLVKTTLGTYTLDAGIENATFTGKGAFVVTGGAGTNVLTGGTGNDTLDGGTGADTLDGGAGHDVYLVDNVADIVIDAAGTDHIKVSTVTSFDLTAATGIENLTFSGAAAFTGIGNDLNNIMTGGTGADTLSGGLGNDTLDGGTGIDTLTGGAGNDIYIVDNTSDVVEELAAGGTDLVKASKSYTLSADVENLTFTGTGAFAGTGNAVNNVIIGGTGNDTLDGGTGADTLNGGAGNDLYVIDNAADVILDSAGTDSVNATVSTFTLKSGLENLTFTGAGDFTGTGNISANAITGGAGNDTLDGGGGKDTLKGGLGNDVYIVDLSTDVVTENAAEGTDEVRATAASFVLGNNLENLTYIGTGNFAGTGNTLANTLTGGIGNDTLDGGTGADTLDGGAGNDVYVLDDVADVVVEAATSGTDLIKTSLTTYSLAGSEVEQLTYTGAAAFTGTGNAFDNVLTGAAAADVLIGGDGNDTLNGGAGVDILTGGLGDDVFVVDTTDTVVELAGEGTDTISTTLGTYTLALNFENLTYTGKAAFVGTGNDEINILIGGTGSNTLNGGLGDDTLTGNTGSDRLNGGAGADTMTGGTGNDTYVVDDADDVVTELSAQGTDTVETTLSSYTLVNTFENLTYKGSGDFVGTGNSSVNIITGGAGNDTLSGGTGADTLIGGAGNDIYIVDNLSEIVTELAGGGTDEVRTSASSFTLGAFVENLTYTHTGSFKGVGNGLDNIISGGNLADNLNGAAGADTLIGGTGNDVLTGGTGSDIFVFADGDGTDRITDFGTGGDQLDLTGVSGLAAFADVQAAMTQVGKDTRLTFGTDVVILVGVTSSSLNSGDFLL